MKEFMSKTNFDSYKYNHFDRLFKTMCNKDRYKKSKKLINSK